MLERIASQVRALRTQQPLRPFQPAQIKIACIGNCAVSKLSQLLRSQAGIDSLFFSNLKTWGNYHRDSMFERGSQADYVVAVKSRRGQLFHTEEELRSAFGGKIIFVPLLWIDGFDTLQTFGAEGVTKFCGGAPIARFIEEHGVQQAYTALTRGELRTEPAKRLAASLDRIRELETDSVRISDFIEDRYREDRLMNSVGHPSGILVIELFRRLSEQLDLKIDERKLNSPLAISQASLGGGPRVFSPHDVEELGLKYDYDPDWMLQAKSLLSTMNNAIKRGSLLDLLDEDDIA